MPDLVRDSPGLQVLRAGSGSCCSGQTSSQAGCDCSPNADAVTAGSLPCPRCGNPGRTVPTGTVTGLLVDDLRGQVGPGLYWLCDHPSCQVVYYQPETGQVFDQASVRAKVWFKDSGDDVPLCYCHRVTRGDLKAAWLDGAKTFSELVRATGVSQGACNCQVNNPAGRCCSSAVRQYLAQPAEEDST